MEKFRVEIGAVIAYVQLTSSCRHHRIFEARIVGQSGAGLAKFRFACDSRFGVVYEPKQIEGKRAPLGFVEKFQSALADELGYIQE